MIKSDRLEQSLFEGFPSIENEELKRIIEERSYTKGEFILCQGQPAANLYILLSGEVEIRHKPYDGPSLLVSKLSSGGVFGWSSVLGRKVYTSSAVVIADCSVYCIPGLKLQQFCESHHKTGVVLLEKIAMSVAQQPDSIHKQIVELLQHALSCGQDEKTEDCQ